MKQFTVEQYAADQLEGNNMKTNNDANRVLPTVFDYPYMANRFIQSIIDTGWNLTSEEQNKLSNLYQLSLITELGF